MDGTQLAFVYSDLETQPARLLKTVPIDRTFPEEEANRLAKVESFNKHLFRLEDVDRKVLLCGM